MNDPLTYMNELTTWDDPPEPNEQWERALARACDLIAERDRELAHLRSLADKLRKGVEAVSTLIADSAGVDGLHLNGDIAPWDDLLAGGKYDAWLRAFSEAVEAQRKDEA